MNPPRWGGNCRPGLERVPGTLEAWRESQEPWEPGESPRHPGSTAPLQASVSVGLFGVFFFVLGIKLLELKRLQR